MFARYLRNAIQSRFPSALAVDHLSALGCVVSSSANDAQLNHNMQLDGICGVDGSSALLSNALRNFFRGRKTRIFAYCVAGCHRSMRQIWVKVLPWMQEICTIFAPSYTMNPLTLKSSTLNPQSLNPRP